MAWWTFGRKTAAPPAPEPQPVDLQKSLTAAASPSKGPFGQFMRHPDKWQNEAWGYFDTCGEFNSGIAWLSNMVSRVRLRAAQLQPDSDEPTLVDSGPAAQIMQLFGNGIGGKSEVLRRLAVQLSVPGECYLIAEEVNGVETWQVRSVDEVRAVAGAWQVTDEVNVNLGQIWRNLATESLAPIRVWRPHDRFYHIANSPARAALDTLRELTLVNRHITAGYLSRLASAGVLIMPDEFTFPVREEFADAEDPFMAEWIEIAAEAIRNPGAASAIVPIPMRMPGEFIKDVLHLDFTLKMDETIIAKRDSVIKRLATQLDVPSDIMMGLGDTNHWNAWAIEESGLKVHIAPMVETICDTLTRQYLQPRLAASVGQDGVDADFDPSRWVVWYDMSELTIRPDRSAMALDAYDRLELSGDALRRETGFDSDDEPSMDEVQAIALKQLIRLAHGAAPGALNVLIGKEVLTPATVGPGAAAAVPGIVAEPGQELPPGDGVPAPPAPAAPAAPADNATKEPTPKAAPKNGAAAAAEPSPTRRKLQAETQHGLRFESDGCWNLYHPGVCARNELTCPFSFAVMNSRPPAWPGGPGMHACHLDADGHLVIDGAQPFMDTAKMRPTRMPAVQPLVNGGRRG